MGLVQSWKFRPAPSRTMCLTNRLESQVTAGKLFRMIRDHRPPGLRGTARGPSSITDGVSRPRVGVLGASGSTDVSRETSLYTRPASGAAIVVRGKRKAYHSGLWIFDLRFPLLPSRGRMRCVILLSILLDMRDFWLWWYVFQVRGTERAELFSSHLILSPSNGPNRSQINLCVQVSTIASQNNTPRSWTRVSGHLICMSPDVCTMNLDSLRGGVIP